MEQEKKDNQRDKVVLDIEDSPFNINGNKSIKDRKGNVKIVNKSPKKERYSLLEKKSANPEDYEKSERKDKKLDFDRWVKPLTIATAVSASCFLVSAAIFVSQRRKK